MDVHGLVDSSPVTVGGFIPALLVTKSGHFDLPVGLGLLGNNEGVHPLESHDLPALWIGIGILDYY